MHHGEHGFEQVEFVFGQVDFGEISSSQAAIRHDLLLNKFTADGGLHLLVPVCQNDSSTPKPCASGLSQNFRGFSSNVTSVQPPILRQPRRNVVLPAPMPSFNCNV